MVCLFGTQKTNIQVPASSPSISHIPRKWFLWHLPLTSGLEAISLIREFYFFRNYFRGFSHKKTNYSEIQLTLPKKRTRLNRLTLLECRHPELFQKNTDFNPQIWVSVCILLIIWIICMAGIAPALLCGCYCLISEAHRLCFATYKFQMSSSQHIFLPALPTSFPRKHTGDNKRPGRARGNPCCLKTWLPHTICRTFSESLTLLPQTSSLKQTNETPSEASELQPH